MSDTIDETFSATGTSDVVNAGQFAMRITGTFVATIELQANIGGVWERVADAYTASQILQKGDNGAVLPMRYECTAYTSGSPRCVLKSI